MIQCPFGQIGEILLITQLTFIVLQLADFVTTMIALHTGGVEKNSLVSHLMIIGSLQGLILSKVLILGLALAAVRLRKQWVLRWVNVVFGGVVLWNLVMIARLAFRAHAA
jgi:hypothetical protein